VRILAYVEPHPIRNSPMQFGHVGRIIAQGLSSAALWEKFEYRILANHAIADQLSREVPQVVPWLLRPTAQEAAAIREYDRTWNEAAIEVWLGLVTGRGSVSALYAGMLRRIHAAFPFEVVLLWSENGAVTQVARELGATPVHAELGPTRRPFPPTVYLDGRGTNGNASVTRVPLSVVESARVVPRETWLTPSLHSPSPGLLESGVSWPSPAVSALLPREPYVFIPMQFADDLNTLSHSGCRTPAEFIESVIPECLERGLRVVVKGHPGVAERPYNLAMEIRALATARAMGDEVVVLPRSISSSDTLAAVAQANSVCTINSSLGFESILIGKSVSLLGAAVYDVHGRIRERGRFPSRSEEHVRWETQLASFLMGHYLLPLDDVLSGEALLAGIRLIREEQLRQGDFGDVFWSSWLRHMRFGWRDLVSGEPGVDLARRSPAALSFGWSPSVEGELRATGDRVDVHLRSLGSTRVVRLVRVHRHFVGNIDDLEWRGDSCRIRGWAFDDRHKSRAVALLIASADTIVACVPISQSRPDVAASLGLATAERSGFEQVFRTESSGASLQTFLVSDKGVLQEVALRTGPMQD
jgi:Capsule polysaccharide biosynthesis protein